MATSGNISTTLTLDASKFTTALDKASGDLTNFDGRLKSATKVATDFEKNVSGLGGNLSSAAEKFKLLDQTLNSFISKLAASAEKISGIGTATKSVKKASDELAGSLNPVKSSLAAVSKESDSLRVAMESLKPSLQQAAKGQRDLAIAQDKTAESAKKSSADGIRAQIAALEAQKSTNATIIAQKEKLARELERVEQQIRNQALGRRVSADNIESRLGAYGGKNKIATELAEATRLTTNADFIKSQAQSAIAAKAALQSQNEELAKSITLMQTQAKASEDNAVKTANAEAQAASAKRQAAAQKAQSDKDEAKAAKTAGIEAERTKRQESAMWRQVEQDKVREARAALSAQKRVLKDAEDAFKQMNKDVTTAEKKEAADRVAAARKEADDKKKIARDLANTLREEDKKLRAEEKAARLQATADYRTAALAMRDSHNANMLAQREAVSATRQAAQERMALARQAAAEEKAQAQQIAQMWKGMAQMWGAAKIEGGLKASVGQASQREKQDVLVQTLNYSADHNKSIADSAFNMSKNLGFISTLDAIKSRMSAIASIGYDNADMIDKTLTSVVKAANNLQSLGVAGHGDMQTTIRNLYGVVEMRQQTGDAAATNNTFELMQKIITGTQGKVQTSDMETVLRRMGMGAAQLNDQGMINLAAVVDQFKVAGGEGGGGGASGVSTVGTAFKMMQSYALGKGLSNTAVKEFAGAGILSTDGIDLSKDSAGVLKDAKHGGFKDADLWLKDPVGAVQKIFPQILKYVQSDAQKGKFYQGREMGNRENDMVAIAMYLARLGITTTASQALMVAGDPESEKRIKHQSETIKGSKGIDAVDNDLKNTYTRNLQEIKVLVDDVAVLIGNTLLPPLKYVLTAFRDFMSMGREFARDNPIALQLTTIGTAIGGVVLGVAGFTKMFGWVGSLTSTLTALVTPVAAVGSAAAATSGTIGTARLIWLALQATIAEFGASLGALILRIPLVGTAVGWVGSAMGALGTAMGWVGGAVGSITSAFVALVSFMVKRVLPLAGAFMIGWDIGTLVSKITIGTTSIGEKFQNMFLGVEVGWKSLMLKIEEKWLKFLKLVAGSDAMGVPAELEANAREQEKLAEYKRSMTIHLSDEKAAEYKLMNEGETARLLNRTKKKGKDDDSRTAALKEADSNINKDPKQDKLLGKLGGVDEAKKRTREFEDMFQRSLAKMQGQAAISSLKLGTLRSGDVSYKAQAEEEFKALWLGGDFDKGHDPRFRQFRNAPKGAKYGEKNGWSDYSAKKGYGADEINMADPKVQEWIKAREAYKEQEDLLKSLAFARTRFAATADEADAAASRLADGGLAKESDAMKALRKEYAREEESNPEARKGRSDINSEYFKTKREALLNQSRTDMSNFGADAGAKAKEMASKLTLDGGGNMIPERVRLQKELDATKAAEQAKFDLLNNSLTEKMSLMDKESAEYKKVEKEKQAATEAFGNWKKTHDAQAAEATMTPLQKQLNAWKNVTDQIEQMEAAWANSMMDGLTTLVTQGVGSFAELRDGVKGILAGMAKDVATLMMKDAMGGFTTSIAKSLGSSVSGFFSDNKKGDASGITSDAAAGGVFTGLLKKAGTALGGFWDSITGSSSAAEGLTNAVGQTVAKTGLEVVGIGTKMTAEQTATASLLALASAASAASVSMGGSAAGGIFGMFGGLFGGGGAGAATIISDTPMLEMATAFAATGGISGQLPNLGKISMRAYAGGGIARSPQLSLFGEAGPEAYVPLPDGRTIPVTLSGGAGGGGAGGQTVNISIIVNNDGTEKTNTAGETGDMGGAWKDLAGKVKAVVRDELVSQKRPGGMLYGKS